MKNKMVISVFGADRPGIVAAVSKVLFEHGCNIEDVSQTTLQSEFAAIFIVPEPERLKADALLKALQSALGPLGQRVFLKPMERAAEPAAPLTGEPFVVTTTGPDRLGLVAGITDVMARFGVNITNLRAAFRGGDDPLRNTMIYEVQIPLEIDRQSFREALRAKAAELGLELSIQHRHIFQAVHRV